MVDEVVVRAQLRAWLQIAWPDWARMLYTRASPLQRIECCPVLLPTRASPWTRATTTTINRCAGQ